jgi:hypothetical protein
MVPKLFALTLYLNVVDKTQVKQGEAVHLTASIVGEGNFEDIEAFKIEIDNATIYSDDAITTGADRTI